MTKVQLASILGLSITLLACGGSGSGSPVGDSGSSSPVGDSASSTASKAEFIKSISGTNWTRECFSTEISGLTDSEYKYFSINISISSSLESITTAYPFSQSDCNHHSSGRVIKFTTQLEVTDKVISENGIEVYGLNTTFIKSSDITEQPTSYGLIYLNSEKLYFGIATGSNSGQSEETRHSSISLDRYFWQALN